MLSIAIGLSALIYLIAAARKAQLVLWILKPGTMLLIILLAAGGVPQSPHPTYAWAILVGLLFSVAGDVFLMLPKERFLEGLASFLVAHLCYIGALWAAGPRTLTLWDGLSALALLGIAAAMYARMAASIRERGERGLLIPVALYMAVISAMVWRALAPLAQPEGLPFRPALTAAGALLFFLSDAILGWDKFVRPLPARDLLVMSTYFAAQYCFAASVAWPPA